MPQGASIGEIDGKISIDTRDIDNLPRKIQSLDKEIAQMEKVVAQVTAKIEQDYRRVAASLDPLVANTQKYERAEKSLTAALKAKIITQDEHNKRLQQAKDKYLGVNASTLTWRQEVNNLSGKVSQLTNVMGPLGSSVGSVSAQISSLAAASGPLIVVLAGVATAAIGIYGTVKAIEFLVNAVSKGLETQQIIEKLNNSLRNTGSYSRLSAADLVTLAESYELLTGRQKEEIIAAETVLSRFRTLNQDAYPKALNATLAYAKAMGITADAAANKLGPAFEGNTRSLIALKDAGIVFTSGQRKMLTEMVETGKVVEYQNLLFAILKEKVGEVGKEYDNNLTRQIARAKIIQEDFGESIASEVIPALEDVFEELIIAAGGWDHLKVVINNVGHEIGNTIRITIYGIVGMYHDWMAAHDELRANIQGFLANVTAMFSDFLSTLGSIPSPMSGVFNALAITTDNLTTKYAKNAAKFAQDSDKHKAAIDRLAKGLREHRQALEGDTKVYDDHGSAIDDVLAKNKEQERQAKQITKILKEQAEQLRYLSELENLTEQGPQDPIERFKAEQRINDEHEYRISLLKYEEQYGKSIGKLLADQERALKRMDREVKFDLKTSVELVKIDLSPDSKKHFEDSMRDLMAVLETAGDQAKLDAEAYGEFNRAQDQWLQDFVEGWKESFKTIDDLAHEDIAAIGAAVDEGYMTVEEGERAIAQIRSNLLDDHLSAWQGFFSYLGNALGGVFSQVSNLISQIQSARQAGSQFGSMFSGIGAAAGAAAGTIVGVVIAVYDKMKGDLEKRKQQSYGTGASLVMEGGQDWTIAMRDNGRRATVQIRRTIEEFAEALGGVFTSFAALEVQVRRDGNYFRAFVEGVFIGSFQDMESAVEAAILAAFKNPETMLSGVSDLIREGLGQVIEEGLLDFGSMDELEEFLGRLKEVTDIQLGPAVTQTLEAVRGLDRLWDAIERIGEATDAVTGAFGSLILAEARTWQELFDSITGRQKTDKEIRAEKEAELKVAKAELEIRKATIAQRILQAKADIAAYEAGNLFIGGIGRGGGGGGGSATLGAGGGGGLIGIAVAMSKAAEVAGASIALLSSTTTSAVDKMIEALKAEVAGLEQLLGALDNLQIPDINVGGGRGGGGGVDRGEIRDDLREQIKQLEAAAKGPLHEALLSLQEGIEDFTERAKEGKLPPAELARAIELMTKEFQRSVLEQARGYAGLGTEFTKRVQDTKRFFDELEEIGRKKSGIPNWLREVLEGKAFDRLGKELSGMIAEFNGLVDPMLAINLRADELRQNVLAFAQAAGWSGEQIREAMRQIEEGIENQRTRGINSALDRLFGYLKQAGLYQKEAQEFERRKALTDLQLLEAELRFYGALDDATKEWLDAARDFINSAGFGGSGNSNDIVRVEVVNPEDIYGTMIDTVRSAVNEFRSGIEEFTKSTQDLLTDDTLSGLTQQEQLAAAKARFDLLLSQAKGGSTQALQQLTEARREYLEELRQSEGAGFGFDVEWRRIMAESATLLANSQKAENDMIADILFHNETTITTVMNTLAVELKTTLYDVAKFISAAIYNAIGGVPGMAQGGIVMRGPRLIRVAEMGVPEAIVPLDRLMRAVPYTIQSPNGSMSRNGNVGNAGNGAMDSYPDSWYDVRARDSTQRLGAIEASNAAMAVEIKRLREDIKRVRR